MATFDEFYASLDPDIGIRGKQFEKFIKWFLKTDPTWASQVDEVWLWDEYPKRWGADYGIDLIFTHKNGKTWAVQSKCISPNNDIKKSEIDSFLSESNDSKIEGRLLIASTDGIGKNAQQVINRQEKQVVCFLLEQFRQSVIEFPPSMDELNQGKRKEKKKPKPHQIEAIEKVYEGLKTTDRGQVLMACGTGKTLTSLWIKEKLKAEQILVLVPSLSLLSQTLKEWNTEANKTFKWICVCSDKSVAKDKSEDQWISNTSEIGVPVTSEPLEIKNFLDESGSKVVFATYQSAQLIVEAQEHHDTSDFDLVIADEAHRCAGKVSDAFGSVLDENKIKASKRLFFTATPRILSSFLKKNALEREVEVVSMDDYSVFGKILHQIKFSEAIERDLLSDYQVVVIGVDDETIRNQIINREFLKISSNGLEKDAETLASHIALLKATRKYNLRRLITFHGLVKGAKDFAEDHLKINEWMHDKKKLIKKISAEHVSGEMNSTKRNNRISRLRNIKKGEIGILTNARCLSEGVDVPSLDGIAFIDPRQSQIDIIQAVGRAIRKSDEKTLGTIVIPVYLSEISENINEQILASKFSSVWKIILALKSQDDSLMEEIDSLRVGLGERGGGGGGGGNQTGVNKVIIDLPQKLSMKFVNKIQTILIQNTSDDWLEKFGKLKLFFIDHGHSSPGLQDRHLSIWCSKQRVINKKNKLSQQRIRLLETLKFSWDLLEDAWQSKYQELKIFYLKNGHSNFSQRGTPLSKWITVQRSFFKNKKLSQQRISLLENLNFVWDPIESLWEIKFQDLKDYYSEHGHSSPSVDNPFLSDWCSKKRKEYKKGKLSQERIDLLESLNFSWDVIKDKWQSNFKKLENFYLEHQHLDIPPLRDSSLYKWISDQRKSFKKGNLSTEQVELLEGIGFSWNPVDDAWQSNFEELKDFYKRNGNLDLPPRKESSLARWVSARRIDYKKGKLSQERIHLLESIGLSWDEYKDSWQRNFEELKEFYVQNGHSNFYQRGVYLSKWISDQRKNFRKGKLSEDKIKLLRSINLSWEPVEDSWQKNFREVKNFYLKNGHMNFSREDSNLRNWVGARRKDYKKGILSQERIDLLESIGLSWDPVEDSWQKNFQELKAFELEFGHANPSKRKFKIGVWCVRQRILYKKGKLSQKHIELLQNINGWVWKAR